MRKVGLKPVAAPNVWNGGAVESNALQATAQPRAPQHHGGVTSTVAYTVHFIYTLSNVDCTSLTCKIR
jgi:hypothetical protein